MRSKIIRIIAIVCFFAITITSIASININNTVNYLDSIVKNNSYDGMLDWPILGLASNNRNVSTLVNRRETQVRNNEMFTSGRSTDYHRTIIGAVAGKKNPKSFGGYNLINDVRRSQLSNGKFGDTISNGGSNLVNAHIWGIISLYSAGEVIPNQERALKWLVDNQNNDGGYSIDTRVKTSDIDMTGMALIAFGALGQDRNHPSVRKAITYLKNQQGDNGDFSSWSGSSSESLSQVIQGLVMLEIDPTSSEWKKANGDLVTALLRYRKSDGSFSHSINGESNTMATYQALIALSDYNSKESIYKKLRKENISFSDVSAVHYASASIKKLAGEGIIQGYPDGTFKPNATVKRQEFATMLALATSSNRNFSGTTRSFRDVPTNHWANPYIKAVVDKNLMKGRSAGRFEPEATITGAEVMTVLVHAAGLEKTVTTRAGEEWYEGYVRVARSKGYLYPNFDPKKPATRAECAFSIQFVSK